MTYREYITAYTKRFNLSSDDVEILLLNQVALIPDADAEADASTAKKALVKEFAALIPLNNISEGGLSLSWNLEAIKMWYKQTCAELGIADTATVPQIKNRSNLW